MTKNFVPCSYRHKSCSPSHAELVHGYQKERERQEIKNEATLSHFGDRILFSENGNKLINFHDWLLAHKGRNYEFED